MQKSVIKNTEIKAGDVIVVQREIALKHVRVVIDVIDNSYAYVFIGYIGTSNKIYYMADGAQIQYDKTLSRESSLKLTHHLQLPIKLKGNIITNLFSNV